MCCWVGTRRTATDDKDAVNMLCGAACVCERECVLMAWTVTENDTKCSSNCGLIESSTDRNHEKTN